MKMSFYNEALDHMRKYQPNKYQILKRQGKLEEYLENVEQEVYEMMDTIEDQMIQNFGGHKALNQLPFMEKAQKRGEFHQVALETARHDLILLPEETDWTDGPETTE
ncbi:MAG: hypothetical protein C0602_00200 [Denitrovibrio sp.]|nr:MAG: hypothetical protein C0602_00200 [Denitrovibrio sp.]